ncbi:hypothetical protein [Solilutibacter oculi]|uniref:hypothetical protein n=1 Tax=Solilutibacter oculi TaxID=2698682 RepID=UPI0013A5F95B|nr:hypothetical protein [Lysobacter oculi]
MTNPYQPPASELASATAQRRWFPRSLVAFGSGVVLIPLLLFLFFRLLFPVEARGYGNTGFSVAVLLGGSLAAYLAAALRRMPFWLVVLLGPLTVFGTVVVWIAWVVTTGAA